MHESDFAEVVLRPALGMQIHRSGRLQAGEEMAEFVFLGAQVDA
jgi:hypothetical protein